jgi:hypothetical protein
MISAEFVLDGMMFSAAAAGGTPAGDVGESLFVV